MGRAVKALVRRCAGRKRKREEWQSLASDKDQDPKWVESSVEGTLDVPTNDDCSNSCAQGPSDKGEDGMDMGTSKNAGSKHVIADAKVAGLAFDVDEFVKLHPEWHHMTPAAMVYAQATMEYLVSEMLELAGNQCKESIGKEDFTTKKHLLVITPAHIYKAVGKDEELLKLVRQEFHDDDDDDDGANDEKHDNVDRGAATAMHLENRLKTLPKRNPPPNPSNTVLGRRLAASPPLFAEPSKLTSLWLSILNADSKQEAARKQLESIYRNDVHVVGKPKLVGFFCAPLTIPEEVYAEMDNERTDSGPCSRYCCPRGAFAEVSGSETTHSRTFCIFDVDVLTNEKRAWKLRAEVHLNSISSSAWFCHRGTGRAVGVIDDLEDVRDVVCQTCFVAPLSASNDSSSQLTESIFSKGVEKMGGQSKKWADVLGALSLLALGWRSASDTENIVFAVASSPSASRQRALGASNEQQQGMNT